jgi:exopolysaccharide production protein ExoZ
MTGLGGTTRLHNLDYLRGLAAFSIMIYHYFSWSFGKYDAEHFLGKIGIYGVSIFYVLSGLTLYHVYFYVLNEVRDLRNFFIKRFFRIFPLLWLTIFLDSALKMKIPDLYVLFLNITGLFGLLKWDAYIGTGVWSIGNELTFYLFFPVFVFLAKRSRFAFYALVLVLFLVFLFFAYVKLTSYQSFKDQGWYHYINPLNQVFLFAGGFLIGLLFERTKTNNPLILILLAISLLVFFLYPVHGERINLVKEAPRLVFTSICLVICFCFYKARVNIPKWIDLPLCKLGEYSYSLYLLHPLVWYFFYVSIPLPLNGVVKLITCVLISLVLSGVVYLKYEKFFMHTGSAWFKEKFGKRLKQDY